MRITVYTMHKFIDYFFLYLIISLIKCIDVELLGQGLNFLKVFIDTVNVLQKATVMSVHFTAPLLTQ